MKAYRITNAQYANTAFDGDASKVHGGRWNSPGHAVVYLADHPATAGFEILVHARGAQLLINHYVFFEAEIPDDLILMVDLANLPSGWNANPHTNASTDFGDAWLTSMASLALYVPSAVVPRAFNILLNPDHPDFDKVTIDSPEPFRFDRRLVE